MKRVVGMAAGSAALAGAYTVMAEPSTFTPLEGVPTNPYYFYRGYSQAFGVSGDGSVVAGRAYSSQYDAYVSVYWIGNELNIIPPFPGNVPAEGQANAASEDGRYIVGGARWSTRFDRREAYRHDRVSGLTRPLGDLPGNEIFESYAADVSRDGRRVAGYSSSSRIRFYDPVVWDVPTNSLQPVNTTALGLPGSFSFYTYAHTSAISGDGRRVFGSFDSQSANFRDIFSWADPASGGAGNMVVPSTYAGNSSGRTNGDGGILAGAVYAAGPNFVPAVWIDPLTGGTGFELLPIPGDATGGYASAVSDDGRTVVGRSFTTFFGSENNRKALMWRPEFGLMVIQDFLQNYWQVDLGGMVLENATDVSDDGQTIVGEGYRFGIPLAWKAFIPNCPADFNADGGVDGGDIEAFFNAWENGRPFADVNFDGGIDGGDVESFFAAWESGGCQ